MENKNEPLVSVVMHSFDRFEYLLNAINSIKNQTYKNLELLLINDESSQEGYYQHSFPNFVKKNILKKSNLTGGLIGVNTSNKNAIKLVKKWEKYSLIQECIAPQGSSRKNHRQDQSILSILKYQNKQKIYSPKMKLNFGIKVNQNPGIKIYISDSFENELKRKITDDWLKKNFNISVNTIKQSNIIWLLDLDDLKRKPKKFLKSKILIFVIFNEDNISTTKLKNLLKVYKKDDLIFLQNEFRESNLIFELAKNQNLKKFSTMQDVESHIKELITN